MINKSMKSKMSALLGAGRGFLLLLLVTVLASASGCVVHSHARAGGRVAVRPAGAVVVRPARVWVPGHFRANVWVAGHWR
jgi:hypothetical protein